jgi:sugar phosphate isomerase/epimerase
VAQVCVPHWKLRTGLSVSASALLHPNAFTLDEPANWPAQRVALLGSMGNAALLGAPCVYVTTGPAWRQPWESAASAFGEALGPLVGHAAMVGVRLAVEPTNPLRSDIGFVHTLRDALVLALACDLDVCVDLFACWYERDLRATLRRAAGRIALVQISDYVPGTVDLPNRAVPGDGVIPLRSLIDAVLEDGYTGAFDLELLGPRITAEGVPAALSRAVAWLNAALNR